jgi:integral membrane protein (TIGR01906 family)
MPGRERGALALVRSLVIGLFILAVPVALITTNIRVAVSEQGVYDYSVRNYGASEASGIPQAELLRANGEIRDYLTADNAGPLAIRVRNNTGIGGPLFNARETAHMADVRDLVQVTFAVQLGSVLLVLALAVVMLMMWPPRALAMAVLCGALLTGGLVGAAGLVVASGFDSAWTEFHVFAFSNDLWQLDPQSDHLIQMFPEAFWQKITTLIVAATLLEALLMTGASAAYLLISRSQDVERIPLPTPALAGPEGHARPKLPTPNPRHYYR